MSKITYRTLLPSAAITTGPSTTSSGALSNTEVDQNFHNLNKTKIDTSISDSSTTNGIAFASTAGGTEVNRIFVNNSNQLQIGNNDTATVFCKGIFTGSLVSAGTLNVVDKIVVFGTSSINNLATCDGGGIQLGDPAAPTGYVNWTYEHSTTSWKASRSDSGTINIRASDFVLSSGNTTLSGISTQVGNINSLLGTNSATATVNYGTSLNSISNNTNFQTAIKALDAENLPQIKRYIGINPISSENISWPSINTTQDFGSNAGVGITSQTNMLSAVAALNNAMLYTIHTFVRVIGNVTGALSGRFYRVAPQSSGGAILIQLPSSAKGALMFRLERPLGVTGTSIRIQPSGADTIEDNITSSDALVVEDTNVTVHLMWDNTSSQSGGQRWRIV